MSFAGEGFVGGMSGDYVVLSSSVQEDLKTVHVLLSISESFDECEIPHRFSPISL